MGKARPRSRSILANQILKFVCFQSFETRPYNNILYLVFGDEKEVFIFGSHSPLKEPQNNGAYKVTEWTVSFKSLQI